MRTIILALIGVLASVSVRAEDVWYGYDACGNRVRREVVVDEYNKSLYAGEEKRNYTEEQLGEVRVRVYPNPTEGQLKVVLWSEGEIEGSMEMYDMQGRRVAEIRRAEKENVMDISSEPSGVYVLKMEVNNKKSTWKVIKK